MSNYTKLYLGHYITVNNNIVDLSGSKVKNLASAVDNFDAINKIDMLNALNPVNTRLDKHESDIAGNKTDIAGHKSRLDKHESDISGNKTDIAGNKSDIATHKSKLDKHDASFNEHNGRISDFNANLSTQNLSTSSIQFANNNSSKQNTWIQTSAPRDSYNWRELTTDSTGKFLVACENSQKEIYRSSDYGGTWIKTFSNTQGSFTWTGITIDSTGKFLAACNNDNNNSFYRSSDYGETWVVSDTKVQGNWQSITMNKTGKNLAVCGYNVGDGIYLSSNRGTSWTKSTADASLNWRSIAMNSTGKYIAAAVANNSIGGIYISSDSGSNWTKTSAPSMNWNSISISDTGRYLSACSNGAGVYLSSDYGSTWIRISGVPHDISYNWGYIKLSSTGQFIATCSYNGYCYISTNYGSSWSSIFTSHLIELHSIVIDGTGQYLTLGTLNNGIYTYFTNNNTLNFDSNTYVTGDLDINGISNFNGEVNFTSSLALPTLIVNGSLTSNILSLTSNPSYSFNFFSITLTQDITGLSLTNFRINGTYIVYISGNANTSYTISHTLTSTSSIKTDYTSNTTVDANSKALMKIYYDGTTYYVSCSAYNSGESTTPTIPDSPTNFSVPNGAAGQTEFPANWNKPTDGGSPILSYTIKQYGSENLASNDIHDDNDPQYATYIINDGDATTYLIVGLVSLSQYWFRIYATNSIGNSVLSSVVGPLMSVPAMDNTPPS